MGDDNKPPVPHQQGGDRIPHGYKLGKVIGEGTFGKVLSGLHILTGETVAIKILEKDRISDVTDLERVSREIHILKLLKHPNIIRLYEVIDTPKDIFLVMEYASGGELFDYIVAHERVYERQALKFFQQIVSGVDHCHKLRIIHRDLKPENLLLDEDLNIKIIDFGLSNFLKKGHQLKMACGSPCYAAPEMIGGKQYDPAVDVWSMGVILFALICGFLPFEDTNTSELYRRILNAEYEIPDFVSSQAVDLLQGMLTVDVTKRFTVEHIRQHPWYMGVGTGGASIQPHLRTVIDHDLIKQLEKLGFDPTDAIKDITTNEHNHATATYHLLQDRKSYDQCRASKQAEFVASTPSPGVLMVADGNASSTTPTTDERRAQQDTEERRKGGAASVPRTRGERAAVANLASIEEGTPTHTRRGRGKRDGPGFKTLPARGLSGIRRPSPGASPLKVREKEKEKERPSSGPPPSPSARSMAATAGSSTSKPPIRRASIQAVSEAPRRRAGSVDEGNEEGVRASRGVFNVSATSSKTPREIMKELEHVLTQQKIAFKRESAYVLQCESRGILFEAEITALQNLENVYYVRLHRMHGDVWAYKDTCRRLLQSLHL